MKRIVTGGDLLQHAMRPPELLNAYVELVERDVRELGLLTEPGRERRCPACDGAGEPAFDRLGFAYRRCQGCNSLFVSPLPEPDRLERYREEGASERFWRERVLAATAGVRSRHTLNPRAHWVATTAATRLGSGLALADFGSRDPRIKDFLAALPVFTSYVRVAPTGVDSEINAGVAIAFETFELCADLGAALRRCHQILRPGGLLFVSTPSGTGFEVKLLAGKMRSLVPPIHLQLLSRAGWVRALAAARFELVEYSTPGALDVQAVADACRRDPALRLPAVIDELVRHEDEMVGHAFQEVLQQAGLSAHVQFVAARSGEQKHERR